MYCLGFNIYISIVEGQTTCKTEMHAIPVNYEHTQLTLFNKLNGQARSENKFQLTPSFVLHSLIQFFLTCTPCIFIYYPQITAKYFKYSNRESNIDDKLINRGEEAAPELCPMPVLNK